MTERTARLRRASLDAAPSISGERARLVTEFYQANDGRYSVPVMRARCFHHLCEHKTIWIGEEELIVGERGPRPKAVPTYPELTCHSVEDLRILNSRPKTSYAVSEDCIRLYEQTVIPYWRGRSMRDRIFEALPAEWKDAYSAGMFTEFMEQRAPGHTVLDGKIYLSDDLAQKLLVQKLTGVANAGPNGISGLTDRELEVFRMIGMGNSTADIAAQLHLSVKTVESHRQNIKRKLGLQKSAELSREAAHWFLDNG